MPSLVKSSLARAAYLLVASAMLGDRHIEIYPGLSFAAL
jgi:hypothetical protein